jgi:hypothetical protein
MKLVIDSKCASRSLHLNISGFSIDLTDISSTGKVAVIEDSDKLIVQKFIFVHIKPKEKRKRRKRLTSGIC